MVIPGEWLDCDDGVVRPVLLGFVGHADGSWSRVRFLLDTGADRTVFTADVLDRSGLSPVGSRDQLDGLGGTSPSVQVATSIVLLTIDGTPVVFRGQYAALTTVGALDMSVIGRDLLNEFVVIVDRPAGRVLLVGQNHSYQIVDSPGS
ncbi:MAG TPA: retropepsin-like aspartic protease [Gemmataceae bacterium]|nr:retropepsin-like aspartic protease [Gemmataceae bacterium]